MSSQRVRGRCKGAPKPYSVNLPCRTFRIGGSSVPGILSKQAQWIWIRLPPKWAMQTAQRYERCFAADSVEGYANSAPVDRQEPESVFL